MDADGQHEASDIKRLLQKMRGGGADAVIGVHGRGSKLQFLAWAMLRAIRGYPTETRQAALEFGE